MTDTSSEDPLDGIARELLAALYASCRDCGGSGVVLDVEESARRGEPTPAQCQRCGYLHAGLNPEPGDELRAMRAVVDALGIHEEWRWRNPNSAGLYFTRGVGVPQRVRSTVQLFDDDTLQRRLATEWKDVPR